MRFAAPMIAFFFISACGKAGSGGKPAPALQLDTILQADRASVSGWPDLKGRTVVLEFWATWCDPCVEEIPHLNGLIDKLQGKPVTFISISDEPRAKVEAFLKDHPMKGWVAADAHAAFVSFGIRSRPHTVIVDGTGRLLGSTYPGFLTAQDLEQALAGKPLGRSMAAEDAGIEAPAARGGALFEARVSSGSAGKASMSMSEEFFHGRALPAATCLAQAYGVNDSRVVQEPERKGFYDVDVTVPPGQGDKLSPAFQLALGAALGLTLKRQTRTIEVFALSKTARVKIKAAAGKNGKRGYSTALGRITAAGMSVADLASSLEDWLGKPVIDETGLKGRYDFELTWDHKKEGDLQAALEAQLGLRAAKAKRPVELLVFSRKEEK